MPPVAFKRRPAAKPKAGGGAKLSTTHRAASPSRSRSRSRTPGQDGGRAGGGGGGEDDDDGDDLAPPGEEGGPSGGVSSESEDEGSEGYRKGERGGGTAARAGQARQEGTAPGGRVFLSSPPLPPRSFFSSLSISPPPPPSRSPPGGYCPVHVGDTFKAGRYTVLSKLGWGHFSTVWLVEDTAPAHPEHARVALKVQKSAPHYAEAARDEITLLTQIREGDPGDAKHCVRLLDAFDHPARAGAGGGTHVCMVFCVLGDNLLSLIRAFGYRGVPLPAVRAITRQVLVALDYLHDKLAIIHTDLKPENVMLAEVVRPTRRRTSSFGGVGGVGSAAAAAARPAARPAGALAADAAAGAVLTKNQKKKLKRQLKKGGVGGGGSAVGSAAASGSTSEEEDEEAGEGGEAGGPAVAPAPSAPPPTPAPDGNGAGPGPTAGAPVGATPPPAAEAAAAPAGVPSSTHPPPPLDPAALADALLTMPARVVDFGNACWVHKQFTSDIQTRQYRCPEVSGIWAGVRAGGRGNKNKKGPAVSGRP